MQNIVIDSYLYVKPVAFDIQYNIEPYIRSCPITSSVPMLESLHVTITRAKEPLRHLKLDPLKEYIAKISGAEVWLSPVTGKKNLVIKLNSPELFERREEALNGIEDFYPTYEPHLTVAYDLPAHRHDYRWWINEILNNFNEKGRYYNQAIKLRNETLGDSVVAPGNYKSQIKISPQL